MLNLISNEVYKVFAAKKVYGVMAIILLANLLPGLERLVGGIDIPISGQNTPFYMLSTMANVILPIAIMVFVADLVTNEYTAGTLKLPLLHPVSRGRLLAAKALALTVPVLFLLFFSLALSYLFGTIFFGWGDRFIYEGVVHSTGDGMLMTFGAYLMSVVPMLAWGMLIMLLALNLSSGGAVVGISMGLLIALSFLGEVVQAARPFLINDYFKFFEKVYITGNPTEIVTGIGVLLVYGLGAYCLTLGLFRRKDILS